MLSSCDVSLGAEEDERVAADEIVTSSSAEQVKEGVQVEGTVGEAGAAESAETEETKEDGGGGGVINDGNLFTSGLSSGGGATSSSPSSDADADADADADGVVEQDPLQSVREAWLREADADAALPAPREPRRAWVPPARRRKSASRPKPKRTSTTSDKSAKKSSKDDGRGKNGGGGSAAAAAARGGRKVAAGARATPPKPRSKRTWCAAAAKCKSVTCRKLKCGAGAGG